MRYFIKPPTNSYGWIDIGDSQSAEYWSENGLTIATVSVRVPNAAAVAQEICDTLNRVN